MTFPWCRCQAGTGTFTGHTRDLHRAEAHGWQAKSVHLPARGVGDVAAYVVCRAPAANASTAANPIPATSWPRRAALGFVRSFAMLMMLLNVLIVVSFPLMSFAEPVRLWRAPSQSSCRGQTLLPRSSVGRRSVPRCRTVGIEPTSRQDGSTPAT